MTEAVTDDTAAGGTTANANDDELAALLGETGRVSSGPGGAYEIYARNELVNERLKLLDYVREFVPLSDSFKVLPRHFFVRSTNVGEQFFTFTNLTVWLLRIAGIAPQLDMPHEFDDPNVLLANIINASKAASIDVPFSAARLKSGAGAHCIYLLDRLTAAALQRRGHRFERIEPPSSEQEEDVDEFGGGTADERLDDDLQIAVEQFDEDDDVAVAADDDEEEDENGGERPLAADAGDVFYMENGGGAALGGGGPYSGEYDSTMEMKPILHSFTDSSTMTAELRRVMPQLKIAVRSSGKDWKMLVEQLAKHERAIDEPFDDVLRPFLTRSVREIGDAMERISSRESHLNTQLDHLMLTYRQKQNELAAVTEKYRESSGTLNNRAETLNNLNAEIELLKQQIEEQGIRNTNATPILKIKQSLKKLEHAIHIMRMQIVVAEQALMQSQLAERLNITDIPPDIL